MKKPVFIQTKPKIRPVNLNWQDNPYVQKLLDVVVGIMAEEYIRVARENEDVFGIASAASRPRNDEGLAPRSDV